MAATASTPGRRRAGSRWLLVTNRRIADKYVRDGRTLLAVGDAGPALAMADAGLALSPRHDGANELRARALLALRRYRDVADMLHEHMPCQVSRVAASAGDDSAGSSSGGSSSGDLVSLSRARLLSPGRGLSDNVLDLRSRSFRCFGVSDIKRRMLAGISKNAVDGESHWRYLVLGQACFHLGLMEDAMVLLQTARRLACAAFRRESVHRSEDSFVAALSSSSSAPHPDSCSSSSSLPPAQPVPEWETTMQLLSHVKLLIRRRTAAMAALDADHPAEAVRHFSKILDSRRTGNGLPSPFAAACFVGRAAAYIAADRRADAIADCNRALALDPAWIPALLARADVLESIGALPDCLRDLDHLKLLYDAALRDGKMPGPRWRTHGTMRYREVPAAHRALTARIQELRRRIAVSEGCNIDYYALIGVPRGCTRSELERAHLLLTLKHKPDRAVAFADRMELVGEHRDLDAVRDQARMSAMLLYRMLQKGYSSIMSNVIDNEAAERIRLKEETAAATKPNADVYRRAQTMPPASSPESPTAPVFQGVFCRDLAAVSSLLSRSIPVKCEALSC